MKTVVTIAGSDVNACSQIIRAALAGSNACARLNDKEHMDMFLQLKSWAEDMHEDLLRSSLCASNPSCG